MSGLIALIGKKVGMSTMFARNGAMVPVTLVQIVPNAKLGLRTKAKDGYEAIIIAGGESAKSKSINKPQRKLFDNLSHECLRLTKEFRLPEGCSLTDSADSDGVKSFTVGDYLYNETVDVVGISVGKGFQGPMKRWGFAGLDASRGVSVAHRSHGSTGCRQDPGRVFKGKKMAGRMGAERITVQNLRIIDVDTGKSLIAIRGSVPGHAGSLVMVKTAIKSPLPRGNVALNGALGIVKRSDS